MTGPDVGLCLDPQFGSISDAIRRAQIAEAEGASSLWLSQLPNQRDSFTLLGVLAAHTQKLRLGCGIVPLYSRPAVVTAQTALTLDEASGGRIEVGLGTGANRIGEWTVGLPVHPPLPSMRDYVEIVRDLVRGGEVNRTGVHSGHASYVAPRSGDLPVLVGGFGPKMVRLAAEIADGVIVFMSTVAYVESVVMPAVRAGLARRAGPAVDFRVLAIVSGGLSAEPAPDLAVFRRVLDMHLRVPSYRALFERSGHADSVAANRASDRLLDELFVAGTSAELVARLDAYRAVGVDEILITPSASCHDDDGVLIATLRAANAPVAAASAVGAV